MVSTNGKPQPQFSVDTAGLAESQLLAIVGAAVKIGRHHLILPALKTIRLRLQTSPAEFGEPLYHIAKMKVTIYCAAVVPLYVEYGLHDENPVVMIRRFVALEFAD